ncbi:WxL domain-containing protein [Lapidilactobacillus wuchangensis]|uniref:WxL domain-containing protein n=1 Tax=Lapidilactobacillus wuchangensis TaxID=2486001 RepID=UPI000F773D54|nr:WxL domain-containing protein [Lapidilactobacillus wuchangensis]
MKFTKITGMLLASATIIGSLAFGAPAVQAATVEGNAEVNGGQALPQNGQTTAGISFGQTDPTGNTGYLRLQQVPNILDFGNHELFDAAHPIFNASGENVGVKDNDRYPSYLGGSTNLTAILNSSDAKLADVTGKTWATVVDKQDSRTAAESALDTTGKTNEEAGSWELSVKADGPLALLNDAGKPTATTTEAVLSMANTAYGRTHEVYGLTNETQDDGYVVGSDDKDVAAITKTIAMNLSATDSKHVVASADKTEGAGANVFGWNKNDIRLVMPSTFAAQNGTYETTLTWTLATGLN